MRHCTVYFVDVSSSPHDNPGQRPTRFPARILLALSESTRPPRAQKNLRERDPTVITTRPNAYKLRASPSFPPLLTRNFLSPVTSQRAKHRTNEDRAHTCPSSPCPRNRLNPSPPPPQPAATPTPPSPPWSPSAPAQAAPNSSSPPTGARLQRNTSRRSAPKQHTRQRSGPQARANIVRMRRATSNSPLST